MDRENIDVETFEKLDAALGLAQEEALEGLLRDEEMDKDTFVWLLSEMSEAKTAQHLPTAIGAAITVGYRLRQLHDARAAGDDILRREEG